MDDDQLEMLQREFMAVQQQKTNPLSERTVAEIMVKLHKNGFDFYPTTDGNQYVTPERLDREISSLVKERNKILIGLLPQILNINLDAIESRLASILKDSGLIRHNNYLLSRQEINSVISLIKGRLELEGRLDLQEIALSNQFNMVFTRKIVQENLPELNAELIDNQLITNEFQLMQKSRVLGYLNAVSRPIHLDIFQKNANIHERNLEAIIELLIREKKLAGRCQNSYFVPIKFARNQKRIINKFFANNGYLQFSFLQKNMITSKQEEWLSQNLDTKHVCFGGVCFSQAKLEDYQAQLNSLLKGQGLVQVSNVIPFELDGKNMNKFLTECCSLKHFVFNSGYCYSHDWLDRCALEFRENVVYNIFFKKVEEGKKKAKKKEVSLQISEEELVETLYDGGLAEYSVLEDLAPFLLPVLNTKLSDLKAKCEKELGQSKGIINSGFLKYKRCKTILKTQDNLTRSLNTIEKQKKKTGKWEDPDFGPNQKDKLGKYSLIYYDGVLPKTWAPLQGLSWLSIPAEELVKPLKFTTKSPAMRKGLLPDLVAILDFNIRVLGKQIDCPIIPQYLEKKQAPFVFQFFTSQKERRLVLVDQQLPNIDGEFFGCDGPCGLIEKAYSKLRYCYKATLSVGIQQLIFELTGRQSRKVISDHNNTDQMSEILIEQLKNGSVVFFMAEGEMDKKLLFDEDQSGFECCKPYSIHLNDGDTFELFPGPISGKCVLPIEKAIELFKQAYIII